MWWKLVIAVVAVGAAVGITAAVRGNRGKQALTATDAEPVTAS
ncbi:MAG TPA: hypothetical protein VHQ86_03980 [Candidatus Saccharimonadia bacterium]|jgi:hypothetical protein|nr:hypothetical protein [Candidatus Saccharimonadia bacterium]